MSNYENLKVWHRAIELAFSIYKLTEEKKLFQKDFGLKDQMRRASVSISSNIGYISEEEKNNLLNECKGISGMLTNLIKSRAFQ